VAPARDIGQWVETIAGEALATRGRLLEAIERTAASIPPLGERSGTESPILPSGQLFRGGPEARRDRSDPQESGPRPRSEPGASRGAGPSDNPLPYDVTLPQAARESRWPPQRPASSSQTMPAVGRGPGSGGLVRPPDATPQGGPTSSQEPGSGPHTPRGSGPHTAPSSGPYADQGGELGLDFSRPSHVPRPRPAFRPSMQEEDTSATRASLRERLESPLKLVALGVVISVLDWAAREYTASLPIRPSWFAETLVILGVLWAAVRVFF
jgi:hypothetical protein